MSTRHPPSSSIPVRGTAPTSPARHIESVISIPFSTSPTQSRPRIPSRGWPTRNSPGTIGIPHGVRGNGSITSSPPRPTSRSFSHSSVLSARGSTSPYTVYEPRVIRTDSTRTTDAVCPHNPAASSGSPSRTRPRSASVRTRSAQRPSATHIPAPAETVSFPRPAYLEHSALRHLLQTESSPLILPRKTEPVLGPHPMGARRAQRSPSYDSEEDDMSPPPREVQKSTPSPVTASSPILLLPTRWCDEYRNAHLSVCGDGRELIYQGELLLALCY